MDRSSPRRGTSTAPSVSSTTDAVHQSNPNGVVGCIGSSRSLPSGSVSTTDALTASWPSRNTVARIGMDSPTDGFRRVRAAFDDRRHLVHRNAIDGRSERRLAQR